MASIYSKFEIIRPFGGNQSSEHKKTNNSLVIGRSETILANLRKLNRLTVFIMDETNLIDDQQRDVTIEKLVNIVLTRNKDIWLKMSTAKLSEESFPPFVVRYRLKPFSTRPRWSCIEDISFTTVSHSSSRTSRIKNESLYSKYRIVATERS
jgi:hypothetical protein